MSRGSIIIPAHDEQAVIGRTLAALDGVSRRGLRVLVVCNGCTDRTAAVARQFEMVEVIEIDQASKTAALRAGDARIGSGPRIYLDADVRLTGRAAEDLTAALAGGVLAGRPPHTFDTTGASWWVRRWYAVRERLPSIANALWGAGCYALSEEGRARFGEFPEVVSDDLFIDSMFGREEITIVDTDPVVVTTPRRTADLLRILQRSYRTQNEVRGTTSGPSAGQLGQIADLACLLRRDPGRVPDVLVYAAVVVLARIRARRAGRQVRWERDVSSRS